MGTNSEKNRQKKMAKRKAKTKLKQRTVRKQGADASGNMGKVVACLIDAQGLGMASFMLVREAADGTLWVGGFVVDFQCLGVKDSFFRQTSSMEIRDLIEHSHLSEYSPESMKTAVLAGVEYAKSVGFEPHKDYKKTLKIFKGIDESSEPCEFELGNNGQPLFVAGPFDSPSKCENTLKMLVKTCGKGNFNYILSLNGFDEESGRRAGSEEYFD